MDAYDLQARHAPVVFASLPIILVAIALVPEIGQTRIQAGGIAFLLLLALVSLLRGLPDPQAAPGRPNFLPLGADSRQRRCFGPTTRD